MDQEKLTSVISKLEEYSASHPGSYRLRVTLLALLGYAYLAAVVIALLAVVYVTLVYVGFSAITIKFVWIPLVLVGLVLRSLWITIPEPEGTPLSEADAPPLFALISEIQRKLNGPTVHTVLLSDEFNAGIVQIPRFGMFGWLKNYLVVGLPLLAALRPDELRAALAHEFGHLSGKHGNFSGWIYRIRASWIQILTAVHQERHYASFLFEPFLKWYAPFFNAYSFVLARMQEYEADKAAAQLAGKQSIAKGLVHLALVQRRIGEEFWPEFYSGAREQPQPPKNPFSQFVESVRRSNSRTTATKWFLLELSVKTGYDDTHPALVDRLVALGFEKETLISQSIVDTLAIEQPTADETAAHHYLPVVPDDFVTQSNRVWREQVLTPWRATHAEIEKTRTRLAELDKQAETKALSVDEQWERAGCVRQVLGPEAGESALKELLAVAPDHAMANVVYGSVLLERDDAAGIRYLETAKQHDADLSGMAFGLIANFYLGQGRIKEAEDYRARAEEFTEAEERRNEQLMTLSPGDRLDPHGLTPEQVERIRAQMAQTRGLARAFLVRKAVDSPQTIYVVGVMADFTWRDGVNDKHIGPLMDELVSTINLAHPTIFVSLDSQRHLISLLAKVQGSTIFAHEGVVEAEIEMRH